MNYLPLSIDVSGKKCLIVGGGDIAFRKARILQKYNAQIHLVAIDIHPDLKEFLEQGAHTFFVRPYHHQDLDACSLVIAATNNAELNQHIHDDAKQRNLLVNVVDHPDLSNFIFPSLIDRSPISVAVSSNARSPILARLLRAHLETVIPAQYGALASLAGKYRSLVKNTIPDPLQRRRFWESQLQGVVAEHVFAGRHQLAEDLFLANLRSTADVKPTGEVYLVGAGPGDPDLLTFRALRLMQQADVVLYDRLVSIPILELTRKDAQRIYVGKQEKRHPVPQRDINQLLVDLASQGLRVLRLKGGDPFIFGRGGEEIGELAGHGIPFQVVPGITAASGCAAYAGIPLTHRDHAQSVRFLTGHLKNGTIDLPWQQLQDPHETLVFYMGLNGLETICQQLIRFGRAPSTPIALIERGTTPDQRTHIATLADISQKVAATKVQAPTLLIIGSVVSLSDRLRWHPDQLK